MFSDFGKQVRIPALWLYSENDLYWGPALPSEWLKAYQEGGASATFIRLPPSGQNGHTSFTTNLEAWKPEVAKFLTTIEGGPR